MPHYDYQCQSCDHLFEVYQSITADALSECPQCKKPQLRRLIGGGAGVVFKGSGFYQTDYKNEDGGSKSATDSPKTSAKGESSGASKEKAPDSTSRSSKPAS